MSASLPTFWRTFRIDSLRTYHELFTVCLTVNQGLTLPAPIGARVLDRSRTFLFHSSLPGEQLGYRIKVPVVRTFTAMNQPKLSKSHTNSTDLTSRLPDGRSTRDHRKIAAYEQTLKRSAPHAPVLYHRPIGRCFTTGWVTAQARAVSISGLPFAVSINTPPSAQIPVERLDLTKGSVLF